MNILISGIGGPTPKGISNSLKKVFKDIRIIGIDANKFAPGLYDSKTYDKTYLVPNAVLETDKYWETLNNIVLSEKIDFAFIVPETEIIQWSIRKRNSTLPCKSLIPEIELANFLFDKFQVSNFFEPIKLSPKTKVVIKDELSELEKKLGYPYWIRLNKTAGAIGSLKINNFNDIKNWLNINKQYTDFIASEYLPGRNYACKVLYKSGKLILGAVGERIEYLLANSAPSKISGMCSRGKLLNNRTVINSTIKAMDLIFKKFNCKPEGMFTVDFKEDNNGIPKITEINLRHVSFTYAFTCGGANFAAETINSFLLNNGSEKGIFNFEKEYFFIRGVDSELFTISESEIVQICSD